MNLTEAIQALEAKNIAIAINLGTHQHCAIDSNCPLAVELRRLMVDAGVTLEQLLEGYVAVTAPDPVNYNLPEIGGKVAITIAGKEIELELNEIIGEQIKLAMDRKRRELGEQEQRVKNLGGGLYSSYLSAIAEARKTKSLPQLRFIRQELMKANCHVTRNGDSYIFLFPTEYHPEYLVHSSDGREVAVRCKLADEDIEAIRQEAWIELTVRGNRFLNAMLLNREAKGIQHYHGSRTSACWGRVKIPREWDGTLKSLVDLKALIVGSLATINTNSLLNHSPSGMPYYRDLINRSTELGREGTVAPPPEPQTTPQPRDAVGREETPRGGWGTRARGGATMDLVRGTPPRTLTQEEQRAERMRRFNQEVAPQEEQFTTLICLLCGHNAGRHYDNGTVCPRERGE